jgi:hypothetical protein
MCTGHWHTCIYANLDVPNLLGYILISSMLALRTWNLIILDLIYSLMALRQFEIWDVYVYVIHVIRYVALADDYSAVLYENMECPNSPNEMKKEYNNVTKSKILNSLLPLFFGTNLNGLYTASRIYTPEMYHSYWAMSLLQDNTHDMLAAGCLLVISYNVTIIRIRISCLSFPTVHSEISNALLRSIIS